MRSSTAPARGCPGRPQRRPEGSSQPGSTARHRLIGAGDDVPEARAGRFGCAKIRICTEHPTFACSWCVWAPWATFCMRFLR